MRLILLLSLLSTPLEANTIKVSGSTTVNPIVVDAAKSLSKQGIKLLVDTQGGSSGGIAYVAEGLSNLGMVSRHLTAKDRKKFPKAHFKEHIIGYDGVALVVSKSLYNGGIRALTKEQVKKVYESETRNWQTLGGPDQPIVFFNKEPGRGTWEVFAKYLYGKPESAKKVFHQEVGANQEARTKVAMNRGGITQLSASWAYNSKKVKPLALKTDGKSIEPTLKNIKNGLYPMRRPLIILTNGDAKDEASKVIKFLLSEAGQKLVKKHGYLPIHSFSPKKSSS